MPLARWPWLLLWLLLESPRVTVPLCNSSKPLWGEKQLSDNPGSFLPRPPPVARISGKQGWNLPFSHAVHPSAVLLVPYHSGRVRLDAGGTTFWEGRRSEEAVRRGSSAWISDLASRAALPCSNLSPRPEPNKPLALTLSFQMALKTIRNTHIAYSGSIVIKPSGSRVFNCDLQYTQWLCTIYSTASRQAPEHSPDIKRHVGSF